MNKQTSFTNNIVLRVWTILSSDQGYNEAMSNALVALSETIHPDHLYILEEVFDRGPDPYGVINIIKKLKKHNSCEVLLGNHDI